jgi:hypothetical protein
MNMLTGSIAGRLQRSGITVTQPDDDTVHMQGVPLDPRNFSKDRTNLLLRRSPSGSMVLAVDYDLEYRGADPVLSRAFASARRREKWRILVLPNRPGDDAASAALGLLGVTQAEPEPAGREDGLLARFGADPIAAPGAATLGRQEQIARLVSAARAWQPRLGIVSGASGSGKTNLIQAVASALRGTRPLRLVSIDLALLMAGAVLESGREELVARLLDEAGRQPDLVLALENIDRGVLRVPGGPALFAAALDRGVRLLGTVLPESLALLLAPPLARRVEVVELPEMSHPAALEVLAARSSAIGQRHGVRIQPGVPEAALTRSLVLSGALPARALTLLDAAAGRAAAGGESTVEVVHVYLAAADWWTAPAGAPHQEGMP